MMNDDEAALYLDSPETEEQTGQWTGAWRRRIDGPDRNTYRVLREHFRTQCMASRAVCWLCEGGIDYALKHGDAMAWELDHAVPVSVDESLALTPTNFRSSHALHNRQRAAGLIGGIAGDDDLVMKVFEIDGRRIEYWYSKDLGDPSEPW
jgi:hypothetical protein